MPTGTVNITEAGDSVSSAGAVAITGTLNSTSKKTVTVFATPAGTGKGGGGKKVSHIAVSNDLEKPDTHVATGKILVRGSFSKTSSDTLAAATRAIVKATLANTEANDVAAAVARQNSANAHLVEQGDGIAALASVIATASLSLTESGDTAVVNVGGPALAVITEQGDGVAATGAVFTPSLEVVHYSAP
jgi:hypothetical protein